MSVYVTPVQLPVGPSMLPLLPPALVLILLFTTGIMSLAHTHAHAYLLLPISASLSRFRPLLLATAAPPSIHCPCNSRRCPNAPLPYPQYRDVPPPAQPRPVSNSWLHLSVGPHSTRLCKYRASLIFRSPNPALGFWILRLRCRLRLVSCGLSYAR